MLNFYRKSFGKDINVKDVEDWQNRNIERKNRKQRGNLKINDVNKQENK